MDAVRKEYNALRERQRSGYQQPFQSNPYFSDLLALQEKIESIRKQLDRIVQSMHVPAMVSDSSIDRIVESVVNEAKRDHQLQYSVVSTIPPCVDSRTLVEMCEEVTNLKRFLSSLDSICKNAQIQDVETVSRILQPWFLSNMEHEVSVVFLKSSPCRVSFVCVCLRPKGAKMCRSNPLSMKRMIPPPPF